MTETFSPAKHWTEEHVEETITKQQQLTEVQRRMKKEWTKNLRVSGEGACVEATFWQQDAAADGQRETGGG